MRPLSSPPPFPRPHPPHLLEHGPVMRKRLVSRAEDLVGRGEATFEANRAVRHQVSGCRHQQNDSKTDVGWTMNSSWSLTPVTYSPKYPGESAGRAHQEGEREGNGEEDVLVRGIGVETLVVEHQEGRREGYPGHQYGGHAHGVERADPPEDTVCVEEQ